MPRAQADIEALTDELQVMASLDGCATQKMVFHVLRALSQRYKGNADLFEPKITSMPAITEVRHRSSSAPDCSVGWGLGLMRGLELMVEAQECEGYGSRDEGLVHSLQRYAMTVPTAWLFRT